METALYWGHNIGIILGIDASIPYYYSKRFVMAFVSAQ